MKFWFESYFIIFALIVISILSACNPSKDKSKETRISEVNNAVFCLSVIVPNQQFPQKRAIGTGFLVSENLLATAFHVKEDLNRSAVINDLSKAKTIAWKKFDNGDYIEIPIKLMTIDQDADLALYSFDVENLTQQSTTHQIKPLIIADRLPTIGEEILTIGYYDTMEFPFNSLGNISMIDKGEDIYSDMTLMPGNSGSPLVSMKTGEVLGLNVKVMTMGDGTIRLGISKKISKLKMLIEKANSK